MITKEEILKIIDLNDVVYINDLVVNNNRDSYISMINLLETFNINNQKIKVKVYCKKCGKEIVVIPSVYKKQKGFCCEEHIKHRKSGVDSPFYNRIETNCTNCRKLFYVIPAEYNRTNKFGDNHNFCCQKCYWEYRSKYYVHEKNNRFGTHQSDENKDKQRQLAVEMIINGKFPQTMSKPHQKINDLLLSKNINFENEYPIKYQSIDIFLSEYNLMIEIMGDYWHANPLKYNVDKLTKQQKKSIKQDKSKHTYVKKYKDIEILYLWEIDIKKDIDLCWLLIQQYINDNGILSNYHSFNYHIDNGKLVLNDILITPFQDSEYGKYLNTAI